MKLKKKTEENNELEIEAFVATENEIEHDIGGTVFKESAEIETIDEHLHTS